ncbi:MAG: DUF2793 domain-containing protein [Marinomonas sp.]
MLAGQAQKEFFFNEAQSIVDAMLHLAVEGVSQTPPSAPVNGECWIIDSSAQGHWADQDNSIAIRLSDAWKFVSPRNGMSAFDKSSGQRYFFEGAWQAASEPAPPQGGATIDSEARNAITALMEAVRQLGAFPRV